MMETDQALVMCVSIVWMMILHHHHGTNWEMILMVKMLVIIQVMQYLFHQMAIQSRLEHLVMMEPLQALLHFTDKNGVMYVSIAWMMILHHHHGTNWEMTLMVPLKIRLKSQVLQYLFH